MAWFFASETGSEGQLGTAGQLVGQAFDGCAFQQGADKKQSKSGNGSTLPEISIVDDVSAEVGKGAGALGQGVAKSAGELVGREARRGELSPREFLKKATEMFDALDSNQDEYLSPEELATELQNKDNKGDEAQVIAALYGCRKELKSLKKDGTLFRSSPGISKGDLIEFGEMISKSEEKGDIHSKRFISSLDMDADEKLSVTELQKAASRKDCPQDVKKLLEGFIKINDVNGDVRVTDVLRFFISNDLGNNREETIAEVELMLNRAWAAQRETNKSLFGNDDGELENINARGLEQGFIGDCYALSAFAAIAETNPQLIKEMIKDNKDGTFTVTFPGARDETITIQAPTDMERAVYNSGAGKGIWGAVLEKAYGAWCQKSIFRRTPMNLSGGNTPTEGADGGALRLGRLLEIVTGKDADWDFLDLTSHSKTKRKLTEALAASDKVCVIASTGGYEKKPLDVTKHVYAILDYEPQGEDGGTVTIYNPWGIKERISYKEFSKRFNTIAYQKEKWTAEE